jgi:glycosyltransferase involved in cell wall biosynthesis
MSTLPFDNLLPESIPVMAPPPSVVPGMDERLLRTTGITRVLHLINGEYYAGAERVQDLLAQSLPQCGFEVGFVCVKPKQFARLRQSQNTPIYTLPMQNRLDLWVAGKIARIVRREQYSLIHSHTVRTALVGSLAARLAGVPMVYHVHSPMSRNTNRPWLNWINNIVERFSLRRASRLIAVSESLKQHMIRQGFEPDRITVVHNGVPKLYEVPFRRLPRVQWTLGTAALFRPRKGIEILLRALALLRERGLPVRLRAIGEFESAAYEREIHALAAHLDLEDIIEWTGFAIDVTSELLTLDLFVLPSLFGEGLPMVLLEAMAVGVPVVATDVEGITEAVRHGQDGVIAPAGDPKALAQAVADVIEGKYDWSAMRDSALARQAQFFSESAMAEGVAAVYRQVLEEKRRKKGSERFIGEEVC